MEAQGAWILEEAEDLGTLLDFLEEPESSFGMEDSWTLVESETAGLLDESLPPSCVLEEPASFGMEAKDCWTVEEDYTTCKLLEYEDGPALAGSCFLETDEQDQQDFMEADSGFQSGCSSISHSRKTSESNGLESEWAPNDVIFSTPSVSYPSYGINPCFNIWSPSSDDEPLMVALSTRTSSSVTHWESDSYEWGDFQNWNAVPSPAEAAVLLELQKKEEEVIHARAAAKRSLKKAKFFAKINAKVFARKDRIRSRL
ncbi:uncharacterized protein LOC117639487 [Thrips palmi]|uniref:Uncharacterized protein LOC117639487 n=1 Tax=Thrips palmi TaxID=161013 RepID=A0A6P8ZH19_THRPL|nr:uncharacterized protein LOC117639487 [Thrips palmi]